MKPKHAKESQGPFVGRQFLAICSPCLDQRHSSGSQGLVFFHTNRRFFRALRNLMSRRMFSLGAMLQKGEGELG